MDFEPHALDLFGEDNTKRNKGEHTKIRYKYKDDVLYLVYENDKEVYVCNVIISDIYDLKRIHGELNGALCEISFLYNKKIFSLTTQVILLDNIINFGDIDIDGNFLCITKNSVVKIKDKKYHILLIGNGFKSSCDVYKYDDTNRINIILRHYGISTFTSTPHIEYKRYIYSIDLKRRQIYGKWYYNDKLIERRFNMNYPFKHAYIPEEDLFKQLKNLLYNEDNKINIKLYKESVITRLYEPGVLKYIDIIVDGSTLLTEYLPKDVIEKINILKGNDNYIKLTHREFLRLFGFLDNEINDIMRTAWVNFEHPSNKTEFIFLLDLYRHHFRYISDLDINTIFDMMFDLFSGNYKILLDFYIEFFNRFGLKRSTYDFIMRLKHKDYIGLYINFLNKFTYINKSQRWNIIRTLYVEYIDLMKSIYRNLTNERYIDDFKYYTKEIFTKNEETVKLYRIFREYEYAEIFYKKFRPYNVLKRFGITIEYDEEVRNLVDGYDGTTLVRFGDTLKDIFESYSKNYLACVYGFKNVFTLVLYSKLYRVEFQAILRRNKKEFIMTNFIITNNRNDRSDDIKAIADYINYIISSGYTVVIVKWLQLYRSLSKYIHNKNKLKYKNHI